MAGISIHRTTIRGLPGFRRSFETGVERRLCRSGAPVEPLAKKEVAPFAMGSVQSALNLVYVDINNLKERIISVLRYSFGRKYHSAFDELNKILSERGNANFQIIIGIPE